MKKLMSLLIALAMLVMCVPAFAEEESEPFNGSITLDNVFFSIGEEVYDLTDLGLRVAFAQKDEQSFLLDGSLLYNGETVAPAQILFADGGMSVQFGDSGVYTFSEALLQEVLDSLMMLTEGMTDEEPAEEAAPAIAMPSEEELTAWAENLFEKIMPLVENATVTETTVQLNDVETPASQINFSITFQQAFELGKEVISTFPVEGAAALLEGVEYDVETMGDGNIGYEITVTEDGSYVNEVIGIEYGELLAAVNVEVFDGKLTCAASFDDFCMSFSLTVDDAPAEDRISGAAPEKVFDSIDTLMSEGDGMLLALIGMAGDFEQVANDEDVVKLIELFTGTGDEDEFVDYEYDDMECTREEMPFTVPTIGTVLEGYEIMTESYMDYQDGTGYAYIEYTDNGDGWYSISFSNYGTEGMTVYNLVDGQLVPIDVDFANGIIATGDPAYSYHMLIGDVDVNLMTYGSDITVEQAAQILSGIAG